MFEYLRRLKTSVKHLLRGANLRWYHLYFFLAAFDLLTIGVTLYLNHSILNNYSMAVDVNEGWVQVLAETSKLTNAGGLIDGPPNDIFNSKNIVLETTKLNQGIAEFQHQFQNAQQYCVQFHHCVDPSHKALLNQVSENQYLDAYFDEVRKTGGVMISESQLSLQAYQDGKVPLAASHMAHTDDYYAKTLGNIEKLRLKAGDLQRSDLAYQLQQAQVLRQIETIVAFFVLLIIGAVTYFGHRIMTNIRQLEKENKQQHNQIEGLIENIDGVTYRVACDNELTMLYMNNRVEDLTGYPVEGFIGNVIRSYYDIIHPDDQDRVTQSIVEAISENKNYEIEYRICHRDGFIRWAYERGRCVEGIDDNAGYLDAVVFDITVRKVQQQHADSMRMMAETSARHLSEIFEHATDAIVITDNNGDITKVNPAVLKLFEYETDELMGRNIKSLITDYTDCLTESLVDLQLGDVMIVNGRRKDGTTFPVDMSYNENLIDGNVFYTAIFKDSPLRKQYEKTLVDAKDRAEEVGNLKMQFLANMSHEIRTPLNGIIGMLQLFEDTHPSYEQRDYLDTIRSSSETLLGIINDILDLSKIESGKLQLESIPFYPAELLEDIIKLYQTMASNKGIKVEGNFDVTSMGQVLGDPLRTKQIIGNLLNNALKFTTEGSVTVNLFTEKHSDTRATLTFEVKDTGVGIKEDVLPTLFEKFAQADSSTTRKFGGTGLGLSIVRSLVEIMDGDITAESTYGEGTTFRVKLPFELPELVIQSEKQLNPILLIGAEVEPMTALVKQMLNAWNMPFLLVSPDKLGENLMSCSSMPWSVSLLIGTNTDIKDSIYLLQKSLSTLPRIGVLLDAASNTMTQLDVCYDSSFRKSSLFNTIIQLAFQKVKAEAVKLPEKYDAKVLLVEDVAVNQKVAKAILKKMGIDPDLAENGEIAVEKITQNNYDLIFMDCQMPIMDGYKATKTLRDMGGNYESLPIIALTAHAFADEKQKCLDAGMSDYLSKPIKFEELAEMLNQWLSHKAVAAHLEEQVKALA